MIARTLLRRASVGNGWIVEWRSPAMKGASVFAWFRTRRCARAFRNQLLAAPRVVTVAGFEQRYRKPLPPATARLVDAWRAPPARVAWGRKVRR